MTLKGFPNRRFPVERLLIITGNDDPTAPRKHTFGSETEPTIEEILRLIDEQRIYGDIDALAHRTFQIKISLLRILKRKAVTQVVGESAKGLNLHIFMALH
jgi:hypothetical protein